MTKPSSRSLVNAALILACPLQSFPERCCYLTFPKSLPEIASTTRDEAPVKTCDLGLHRRTLSAALGNRFSSNLVQQNVQPTAISTSAHRETLLERLTPCRP